MSLVKGPNFLLFSTNEKSKLIHFSCLGVCVVETTTKAKYGNDNTVVCVVQYVVFWRGRLGEVKGLTTATYGKLQVESFQPETARPAE